MADLASNEAESQVSQGQACDAAQEEEAEGEESEEAGGKDAEMAKGQAVGIGLLFIVCVSWMPLRVDAASSDGRITFQPNVIPALQIHFVEEFFRFQWLGNRFDLKLLVAYEDTKHGLKLLSLKDFWEKDKAIKWHQLKNQATESMYEFGYTIEDIPIEISKNVEYLLWKIEDASFNLSEIALEIIGDPTLDYNITRFHLPDNLVLSYEDLYAYNFTVSHPSKLETKVEGVKGKTTWNLDPITYSTPIITIIGGSEGSELSSQDVYDEVIAQGWNINATNSMNKQFSFNATYCLGNGTEAGETWFADESKQLLLWGPFPRYTNYIEVTNYAHLRFGKVTDSYAKTTEEGVMYLLDNTGGGGLPYQIYGNTGCEIELYSSLCLGGGYVRSGGDATAWNCEFHQMMLGSGWNMYRCEIGGGYLYSTTGTFDDILAYAGPCGWYDRWGTGAVTFTNLKTRNTTDVARLQDTAVQLHLVNADANSWSITWLGASGTAKVIREYTFDLTVTFQNGTVVNGTATGCRVSIQYYGQGGDTLYNATLGEDGTIPQQTLMMGFYNQTGGDTLYSYNPYNLHISNVTDYDDYRSNVTLSQETDLTIALTAEAKTDPSAKFTYSPSNPGINNPITFSASDSLDPDGGALSAYQWTFGDGTSDTGENVTNTYTLSNIYTVTLTVTDDEGASDSFSLDLKIESPGGISIPPLPDDKREKELVYVPAEDVLLTRKDGSLLVLVGCMVFMVLGFSWRVWNRRRKRLIKGVREEWRKRKEDVWD